MNDVTLTGTSMLPGTISQSYQRVYNSIYGINGSVELRFASHMIPSAVNQLRIVN